MLLTVRRLIRIGVLAWALPLWVQAQTLVEIKPVTAPAKVVESIKPAARTNDPACRKIDAPVAKQVCERVLLKELDRELKALVAELASGDTPDAAALPQDQAEWLKELDRCGEDYKIRRCIEEHFRDRLAELQARFGLVAVDGPISYRCDGLNAPLAVSFTATEPPIVLVKQEQRSRLAYLRPTGHGVQFDGDGMTFLEKQGGADITLDGHTWSCILQP